MLERSSDRKNAVLSSGGRFFIIWLIESGILNVSLSDQHFQSIRIFPFSDLIHFKTCLHHMLLWQKIFVIKSIAMRLLGNLIFVVENICNQRDGNEIARKLINWTQKPS